MREYPTVYCVEGKRTADSPRLLEEVFYSKEEARDWAVSNLFSFVVSERRVVR